MKYHKGMNSMYQIQERNQHIHDNSYAPIGYSESHHVHELIENHQPYEKNRNLFQKRPNMRQSQ